MNQDLLAKIRAITAVRITKDEIRALERKHFPVPVKFPLWGFRNIVRELHVTRGRTMEEARLYLLICGVVAGKEKPLITSELKWKDRYGDNHSPDWLYRPPVWILKLLEQGMTVEQVVKDLRKS